MNSSFRPYQEEHMWNFPLTEANPHDIRQYFNPHLVNFEPEMYENFVNFWMGNFSQNQI